MAGQLAGGAPLRCGNEETGRFGHTSSRRRRRQDRLRLPSAWMAAVPTCCRSSLPGRSRPGTNARQRKDNRDPRASFLAGRDRHQRNGHQRGRPARAAGHREKIDARARVPPSQAAFSLPRLTLPRYRQVWPVENPQLSLLALLRVCATERVRCRMCHPRGTK